jgi:hypothetical protein
MLLPELPERDATGRTKEIYEEMKHLGGVPMVALIFRHLATLPGALEWTWDAIGPAWRAGRVQQAAWKIAREVPLKPLARIRPPVLVALGLDEEARQGIRHVVTAYDRANPENMLSILCLLRLLNGASARAPSPASGEGSWVPPPAPGPLPPMIDVATMPSEISALFDLLATPGQTEGPRVVQSLYRHFGHLPGFLALVVTLVRHRLDDGSIEREANQIHSRMSREADDIVSSLSAPAAPHPGIEPVCRRFTGTVIPQMIVVGRLLNEALPR